MIGPYYWNHFGKKINVTSAQFRKLYVDMRVAVHLISFRSKLTKTAEKHPVVLKYRNIRMVLAVVEHVGYLRKKCYIHKSICGQPSLEAPLNIDSYLYRLVFYN